MKNKAVFGFHSSYFFWFFPTTDSLSVKYNYYFLSIIFLNFGLIKQRPHWNCFRRDVTRHQRKPACGVLYQVAQRFIYSSF